MGYFLRSSLPYAERVSDLFHILVLQLLLILLPAMLHCLREATVRVCVHIGSLGRNALTYQQIFSEIKPSSSHLVTTPEILT